MSDNRTTSFLIRQTAILLLLISIPLAIVYLVGSTLPDSATAAETTNIDAAMLVTSDVPSCRNGVTGWHERIGTDVNLGWSISFSSSFPIHFNNGADYLPMIRLRPVYDDNGELTDEYVFSTPQLGNEKRQLGWLLEQYPGRIWIVGNEVDRPDDYLADGSRRKVQDSLMPHVYARAYHEIYTYIKERDPSAQVAISGLVMVTPGRLQYLDMVWESYMDRYGQPMPVDVWTMHAYNLAERHWATSGLNPLNDWAAAAIALGTDPNLALYSSDVNGSKNDPGLDGSLCSRDDVVCYTEHDDVDLFIDQVVNMRQWMKEHGQQNRPLIITEFSTLFPYSPQGDSCKFKDEDGGCFSPDRVAAYLDETIKFLESAADPELGYPVDSSRLVQQWAWFTASPRFEDDLIATSNSIVSFEGELTQMGIAYRDRVLAQQENDTPVDLVVDDVLPFTGTPLDDSDTMTATMGVVIRNRGIYATQQPITVRFVDTTDGRRDFITKVDVPAGIGGCTTVPVIATAEWPNLEAGGYTYEVKVGSAADGPEEHANDKHDNFGASNVIISGQNIYLPISVSAGK